MWKYAICVVGDQLYDHIHALRFKMSSILTLVAQELRSYIALKIFLKFFGFGITDAARISVETMTMNARVWWEKEKRKRFLMLGTNDTLKYVDG